MFSYYPGSSSSWNLYGIMFRFKCVRVSNKMGLHSNGWYTISGLYYTPHLWYSTDVHAERETNASAVCLFRSISLFCLLDI